MTGNTIFLFHTTFNFQSGYACNTMQPTLQPPTNATHPHTQSCSHPPYPYNTSLCFSEYAQDEACYLFPSAGAHHVLPKRETRLDDVVETFNQIAGLEIIFIHDPDGLA